MITYLQFDLPTYRDASHLKIADVYVYCIIFSQGMHKINIGDKFDIVFVLLYCFDFN